MDVRLYWSIMAVVWLLLGYACGTNNGVLLIVMCLVAMTVMVVDYKLFMEGRTKK